MDRGGGLYLELTWIYFFSLLAFGLAFGLAGGLDEGSTFGLAVGLTGVLAGVLAFGLAFGLTGGLAGGLAFGLTGGLAVGLTGVLAFGLAGKLAFGLTGVLVGQWVEILDLGLDLGLDFGSAFGFGFLLGYFRLIVYPFHLFKGFYKRNFDHNPYRHDGVIWIPLYQVESKLLKLGLKEPEESSIFADFLLSFRPLQKRFASKLLHVSTAGLWLQSPLKHTVLEKKPEINPRFKHLRPSEDWYQKIETSKTLLLAYEAVTNLNIKKERLLEFQNFWKEFEGFTLRQESFHWTKYYKEVFSKWNTVIIEEIKDLDQSLELIEPVSKNYYRVGPPLEPKYDQQVFVGREDLKEELERRIFSSRAMPLFLVQGQRRVGKTSVIRFLPGILGSHYEVWSFDLQNLSSIEDWFSQIRLKLNSKEKPKSPREAHTEWLDSWKQLIHEIKIYAKEANKKVVLAFDEYEKLHEFFEAAPKKAKSLLGGMRHISQHEPDILLLFIGAYFFSELSSPDWAKYFVQAEVLNVEYLKEEDVQKLMGVSDLVFSEDLKKSLFSETQGHPQLTQTILSALVEFANLENRKKLNLEDFDLVLEERILVQSESVSWNFWNGFCEDHVPGAKEVVLEILNGNSLTQKDILFKLLEHRFVVKTESGYKLRVPLFEKWIRKLVLLEGL